MAVIKIQNKLSGDNKGSSKKAILYLEKEQNFRDKSLRKDECFFNQKGNDFTAEEAIKKIDSNRRGLGKNDAKYYSLIIAPSQKELSILDNGNLKEYTKNLMKLYAKQFNRDVNSEDLVWFAKLEHTRKNKGFKKNYTGKSGEFKKGDQRHIHILVRRKTDSNMKLSPLTKARSQKSNLTNTNIGFNRVDFFHKCDVLMAKTLKKIDENVKIQKHDFFIGRFIDSEDGSIEKAKEIGCNLDFIKQFEPKIDIIEKALQFHINNEYKNKIKNISIYKGERNALFNAFKAKYNISLSDAQIKKVHEKTKGFRQGRKI